MPKISLNMIMDDGNGLYFDTSEVPKYRRTKNRKKLAEIKRNKLLKIKQRKIQKNQSNRPINRLSFSYSYKTFLDENKKNHKIPKVTFKINTYEDLIKLDQNKKIIILKFIHNLGLRKDIKPFQNYCEFEYRVNREDEPILYKTVLHKEEVEKVLEYLNDKKTNKK